MNDEKQSKVVLYIAMSLDGYIARPDGSVEWGCTTSRETEETTGMQRFIIRSVL